MAHPPPTVPSVLLPELLGFSPQLLLDDIINVANNAVTETVDGMEEFLTRWARERKQVKGKEDWDSTAEVEQGLVAFQTLLEQHVDIAFDFFEIWSLRNIFAIPSDLPIVAPHHKGLNLQTTPEQERELMTEIEELRRRIDNVCILYSLRLRKLFNSSELTSQQRRLKRLYTRAVRISNLRLAQSQAQFDRISFLCSPQLQSLTSLSNAFTSMYDSVSSLPPPDPSSSQIPLSDPSKRPWETSENGYINWAIGQLLTRTRDGGAVGDAAVGKVADSANEVGKVEDVKSALDTMKEEITVTERD